MKKLFTLLAFVITITTFAQAPQGFNYQATVRNNSGVLITNQNVYFKFNVMLNSQTSVPVFTETHYVPTDDVGQVNLIIGQGTATTGVFSSINWGTGNYYLGIELDINTGLGYVAMGTTQLLSVPFALYANSSGNGQAATPSLASVLAVNNSANNTKITNLADPTDAQDAVTKSYVDILQTQIADLQAQISILQNSIEPSQPVSNGVLVKTISDNSGNVTTLNYNGNKIDSYIDSQGENGIFIYGGDLIVKQESNNRLEVMNYSNNLLISSNYNFSTTDYSSTSTSNYTYNLDGSITEDRTSTDTSPNNTYQDTRKTIRFFYQGNCIKAEYYSLVNNEMTLYSTTTYSYDTNNHPNKNITGFYAWQKPQGASLNNEISAITKNASGVVTRISQSTYQYNSQNYPLSTIETSTPYTINPATGISGSGTPTISTTFFTYY
ncbi:hypothetical protein MCEGE10_01577 [Flavobacteriaceae bacterium]